VIDRVRRWFVAYPATCLYVSVMVTATLAVQILQVAGVL
jgi:hypothetical protein